MSAEDAAKLAARAAKFGIVTPAAQQALDEGTKRARAERFSAVPGDEEEAERRRKRQARFGGGDVPVAASAAAGDAAAAK